MTSSLIGGVIIGMGIGLMLRYETSSGGTDMLAKIISKIHLHGYCSGDYRHRYTHHFSCSIHLRYRNFPFFSCVTIVIIGLITSLMKVRK
ncbi:YitT family protein [Peribacillus frigoritolerans]|nr:YitT family protein [Peribacillus frigoritolerans]